MGLRPEVNGTMSIAATGIETFDATTYIYLEDKKTGNWHNMRDGAYTFITTKTDAQSRFVLHFTPPASILTTDASCEAAGQINIEQPGSASWNYKVTDQSNVTVASGTLNNSSPVTITANTGIYSLTLSDNTGYVVLKTIQVGGSQPVIAAFNSSVTTAQAQDNVTFSSSTTNASTYNWDFGDGNTGTGAITNHIFQVEGIYQVTLTVTSASGCTSSSTKNVTVTSRAITGIGNNTDNKLGIWSNDNMVYVDFTKQGKVEAEIELYDILGQLLSKEKFGRSTIYTKAVLNTEAAYIVVKVKNNGIITTSKVFISNVK
jgi:PKD repeat protein